MTVRRVVSVSFVGCLVLSGSVASRFAYAQPKKQPAPAPAPAPMPDAPVDAPPVEEPPGDIEGRDENPDAPRGTTTAVGTTVVVPVQQPRTGYPIEEALRPITLPRNMAEVSLEPRAALGVGADSRYRGSAALRARYGITREIQLGLTYVAGGIYDDPTTVSDKVGFHPGKAIGLDVTVLVRDWIGVRVGVPVWIYRPEAGGAPAIGLTLGAPLKFQFGEKFAVGGLDDLLSIRLSKFAPTFEYEHLNANRAADDDTNTFVSRGFFRISGYGIYQRSPKLALIGRAGITLEDFTSTGTQSDAGGGMIYMLRAGLSYTPRPFVDVGFSLGFDDLSELGSFGPAALIAIRI
ncbi:MAG: hypothetical protein M3680_20005 [Myxococcota bacterium]|nr:hypothetical protein [Myxococcota bacterium]